MMRNFAASAMTGFAFVVVVLALALLTASGVDGSPSDSRSTYHHQDTAKMAYDFGYEHADAHTGNKQGRKETRDGYGNVRGSYNLVEPDGSYRLVEYTADKHNGFVASVKDKHGARTYGQQAQHQHQHHHQDAGAVGHHQQHHRRHQHADGGHHHDHGAY